jgi:serine/threonine-protein kinase
VLDFGIAKERASLLAHAETSSSILLGSPMYMSPEQARGGEVDHRSDLWSVAVVAFELLTGKHPFEGASLGDVFARICGDEVPSPSFHRVDLPGLDAFFRKALERAPSARFASATELCDALTRIARAADSGEDEPALTAPTEHVATGREAPTKRVGRESDTLALAATSEGGSPEGATKPPPPRPRSRLFASVAGGAALGIIASLVWLRAGSAPATGDGSAASAPEPASASSPAVSVPAPNPPEPEHRSDAPPPGAAPIAPSVSAQPKAPAPAGRTPARAGPGVSATSATSATSAAPPAPTVDPTFGVPISKPAGPATP